jgi:hypothetical protein
MSNTDAKYIDANELIENLCGGCPAATGERGCLKGCKNHEAKQLIDKAARYTKEVFCMTPIDREQVISYLKELIGLARNGKISCNGSGSSTCVIAILGDVLRFVTEIPKIDVEPVNHAQSVKTADNLIRNKMKCEFCKGRAYSKKHLTVITRTMKRVEVVFEYCPVCGRKMNVGAKNV